MTAAFSILHGGGGLFSWLVHGFVFSIGSMVARAIGWPVAAVVVLLGFLFLWWRKRRAARRRKDAERTEYV